MKIQLQYKMLTVAAGLMLVGAVVGALGIQTRYFAAERSQVSPPPSAPVEQLAADQGLDALKNDIAHLK